MIDKQAVKQAVKDEWFAELISIHLKEGKDRDYIMNALMINVDEYIRLLELIVKGEEDV